MKMKKIVIIPTYNERKNIPQLVDQILGLPGEWQILFVDDNSPDGTGQIADEISRQYPSVSILHRLGKLGLGSAYVTGMRFAMDHGYAVIGQMDADFSHPPMLLPALLDGLQTADLSLGSRYIPGGSVDHHWPVWRKGLSAFGNWYARTILDLPVRDVTGGFRLWRKEALAAVPFELIRSNGYSFLIEMIYLAHRMGFVFHETPFYFADRRFGLSKMSFQIQREAAMRVWQIRFEYRDVQRAAVHLYQ